MKFVKGYAKIAEEANLVAYAKAEVKKDEQGNTATRLWVLRDRYSETCQCFRGKDAMMRNMYSRLPGEKRAWVPEETIDG